MRCNPHWGGVNSYDQGRHIGDVLTGDFLTRLVERCGTCILYTHLGKSDAPVAPFDEKAVLALRRLADEFRAGRILVTTTRRLLGYRRALRRIGVESTWNENNLHIDVDTTSCAETAPGRLSESDLDGLTFYVSDPGATRLAVDGREIEFLQRNPPDHTGRSSVSLMRPELKFPSI
jgi:hypothetical protein